VTRRIGPSRARRFFLMSETMDADAALSSGLVDVVVGDDAVLKEAERIARELASGPTEAFGVSSGCSCRHPTVHWKVRWRTRRRPLPPSPERRMRKRA